MNPFCGIVEVKEGRAEDGKTYLYIKRLTDFGNPFCHHKATNLETRLPSQGQALQGFVCTAQEARILHGG